MKEQVTDISKVLQGITEEMRLLRRTINQQYAEIIKSNRNINALNLEIRKKDTELINLRSVLDYVTQVISIPELKPVIKKIRHYVMICKNCSECIRTVLRRRSNNVVYDSSVKTLVVYLSVVQFLPYGSHSKFFA